MANKFDKEFEYYRDYYNKFYGGLPYLTERESDIFKRLEQQLKRREDELTERTLERLHRTGTAGSGVGEEYFARAVTEPMQSAYAQLDLQKLAMEEQEKQRRENLARQMALRKIEEERRGRREFWGTLGKIAGGALSGGLTGALAGGVPGAIIGGLAGGLTGGTAAYGTAESWYNNNKIPTDSEIEQLLSNMDAERAENIRQLLKLFEDLYGITETTEEE